MTVESECGFPCRFCVRVLGMRTGIVVKVTAADRDRLEAIGADRNSPQKYVWRGRIALATADGLGTTAVMRATATPSAGKPTLTKSSPPQAEGTRRSISIH